MSPRESDQHALHELHARGRAAWPGVELDEVAFFAVAASRLNDVPVDDIRAADLYLVIACVSGVDGALAALDKHYFSRLVRELGRRGHDAATATEVVQLLRVRFLVGEAGQPPRIAKYDGRGSLATWLRVAAGRIAISEHRRHHRVRAADEVEIASEMPGPELDLLQRRFGPAFETALRSAFEALTARERNLLRYQAIDRLGIDRIAAIHGIHRATAARWLAHARAALFAGLQRVLKERIGIDAAELESILRVLHSKLELSLRWFATPAS